MQRSKKENVFQERHLLVATVNDKDSKVPIHTCFSSEELFRAEDHFAQKNEKSKILSRLLLLIKKGKMFGFNEKGVPTTKIIGLADDSITIFGIRHELSPVSIMQTKELFHIIKENANLYLNKVLKPNLHILVNKLYETIKSTNPDKDEIIHLATTERDLSAPDAGKNRLVAEFSTLLVSELKKILLENNHSWDIELDRVLALKQRTSRAESYGIHRIAQQPLMLYQSRNKDDKILPKEKVFIIDDHIQAGAAISCGATEIINKGAHLIGIASISVHRNSKYFNIQEDVKEFIINLLPRGIKSLAKLNEILKIVGLNIDTVTNYEGFILAAIFSDPKNLKHKSDFVKLLEKYDATDTIHPLFENQTNSLMDEFQKPKVEFEDLEKELLLAIENGRHTIPYKEETILSDQDGQDIRDKVDSRCKLPWVIFDFGIMSKDDFLTLRQKYRIAIITKNTLENVNTHFGTDIDGYIHHDTHSEHPLSDKIKPLKEKPIAYVTNKKDTGLNNIRLIRTDGTQLTLDIEYLTKELANIELARKNYQFLKNIVKQNIITKVDDSKLILKRRL